MNLVPATPARILIVEDDADAARLLEARLRDAGHQVIGVAGSGETALSLAASSRPDLVIMDIVLPGALDGIETANLLAHRQDIPVLYLTAYSDEELYARARATSPLAYLRKPCDERELKRGIELALDRHALVCRLKASEAHLAEAQAVAHIGSWRWNLLQDHVEASAELLRLLGLAADAFEPRFDTFLQLACAEDRPLMLAAMETLLRGEEAGEIDVRLACAADPDRVLRLLGHAHFDAAGRAYEMVGTARDVTAEWQARQEAEAYREQLEARVAERTAELSAANSHLKAEIENRLRMEEALWRNEQRYRSLVDNLPEPILVMQDDQIVFANPTLARLLGYPVNTGLLGLSLSSLVHPDSQQACAMCKQATLSGKAANAPTVLKLNGVDGGGVEVEALTFAFDYEGRPAVLAVLRDLTERRAIERVAERFRAALDSSADAFFLIDPQAMRFIDVNASACASLDYSREQLLQLGPQDIKPQLNRSMLHKQFKAVLAGRPGAETLTTRHQRQDGASFPVEIGLRAFASGGQDLIVAVARDISAQLANEAALRETNARFQQLAENIDEAFWIRDLQENRFLYANPGYERIYGKSVDSLYRHPRSFLSSIHPDDRDRVAAAFEQQLSQPGSLDLEYRVVVENQIRWLWVRTFLIRDADGKVYRSIGLANDMTERRESEEQYRTIIQASMDGFWITDSQGRLLDCNEAACQISGYAREELLTLSVPDLEAKETGQQTAEHMHQIIERGSDRFETRHRRKNGKVLDIDLSAYFQATREGGRFFAFLRDISEHKAADLALRESEARFATVFRSAPIGIAITRESDGRIVDFNDALLAILGYTRAELLGRSTPEIGIWAETAERGQVLERLRESGRLHNMELRFRRKSGEIGDGMVSMESIELAGERHLLSLLVDVTERRQAELALQASEERYRAVVENQTELICRLLADGTLTFVNAVFCRFFGKREEELIGSTWHPCAHPDDVAMIEAKLTTLSPSNPVVMIENRVTSGLGNEHWMQFVNRAFFDAAGCLTQIQSVGRDITDRKNVELALQVADNFKHAVLNAVNTQVAVLDAAGNIVDVNDAWRLFAAENARAAGEPVANSDIGANYLSVCETATGISSEGARAVAQGIRAVLASERKFFQHEYPCHAPHQQRWFQLSVTPLKGRAGGVVVSHSDITAPRLLAEELRQTEARARSILRAAPVGIGVLVERVFQVVNEGMTRMTGYAEEELVGQSARLLYPTQAEFDYVGDEKYRQIREHGIGMLETRWRRKDGAIIDVALSSAPIDSEDLSCGVTFTANDITGEKRAEQARLLHEAAQRDALVREVHHRIKNNLQGVIGLLRQHMTQHPDTQVALEAAIAQINTIAVVYGLQGRMPQSELHLRELLREVIAAAASLALLPQPPRLEYTLDGDIWLEGGAVVSLALILNELIHNAIKHGSDVDSLVIQLAGDPGQVTLRIVNPGGPLPAGFDLTSGQGCGTGLDLVRTLLPRRGASLSLRQHGERIETELVLTPPLIQSPAPAFEPASLP